ncbi:universal stress protein [Halomicroarcula limicola]|uniref:Universal stress protein n=1 Tax=Haloarcula limicola TaxID=1429915 RepID=A0A8J7Y8B9_9EURY|nr:universal stress protein [Halomicroarcula limicola]MBV0923559.1 universal stress protein [Halomicroarcula limicola]
MTILVAIDDDHASGEVLETAIRLGRGLDEELYVVHLVSDEFADAEAKQVRDEIRERLVDEAVVGTVSLEHVGRSGPRPGTRVGHELLEVAADVDITHIVMGHESKGLAGRLASGNAAFAVVDAANVPVTIVTDNGE